MATLLAQARATFTGGGPHAARAACWIARAALEEAVDDLLGQRDHPCPDATMRSKLLVLEALTRQEDPNLASAARSAWHGLSSHCHHHAFELTPPAFEVAHLLQQVAIVSAHPTHRPRTTTATLTSDRSH